MQALALSDRLQELLEQGKRKGSLDSHVVTRALLQFDPLDLPTVDAFFDELRAARVDLLQHGELLPETATERPLQPDEGPPWDPTPNLRDMMAGHVLPQRAVQGDDGQDSDEPAEDGLAAWLRWLNTVPRLWDDEEREALRAMRRGLQPLDEVSERLLLGSLYLAFTAAAPLARDCRDLLDDLLQEGALILWEAVLHFQTRERGSFLDYAWNQLQDGLEKTMWRETLGFDPGPDRVTQLEALERVARVLTIELSRDPSIGELALETYPIEPAEVRDQCSTAYATKFRVDSPVVRQEINRRARLYEDFVRDAMLLLRPMVRLDQSIEVDGEEVPVGVTLQDDVYPFREAELAELRELVQRSVNTLDRACQLILEYRFGLISGYPRTFEAVGCEFGITGARVRQIQEQALRRLREPEISNQLKGFWMGQP